MKPIRGSRQIDQEARDEQSRNLQKVTINFEANKTSTTDTDSTSQKVALQTTPLPFQQSQVPCSNSEVYGYTTLSALRDDLRVYFEIINGKPPVVGETVMTSTEGTVMAPPVFDNPGTSATLAVGTGATLLVTDENSTLTDLNVTSVESGTGATVVAGIVSTTPVGGTGPTDTLMTTAAAISPDARKRIRAHIWEERRMQDVLNDTLVDNSTDVGENVALVDSMENSTDTGELSSDENGTLVEDLNGTSINNLNGASDNTTDWGANLTTSSLSTIPNTAMGTEPPSESNPNLSIDFEIEPSIPVQFNICPGVFDFESEYGWGEDPLVIQALTRNPVWIRCVGDGASSGGVDAGGAVDMAGNDDGEMGNDTTAAGDVSSGVGSAQGKRNLVESACVFSGGLMHISFNSHGSSSQTESDGIESSTERNAGQDPQLHPLTISGISFQKSSQAAVSMHDPRGEINFEDCEFAMNEAASMVIDGRYEGTPGAPVGAATGSGAAFGGSSATGDGGRYTESDDTLLQFYQENSTPAPVTARPSPHPDSPDPPTTPYPTTALRIPIQPTSSPHPTVAANKLYPPPELGGYSGPPTISSTEENVTDTDPTSFLLPTTVGSGTTAFVDSSTTWNGFMGSSSTTTHSTSFGFNGTDDDTDDFMAEPGGEDSDDGLGEVVDLAMTSPPPGRRELDSSYYNDADLYPYEVVDDARLLLSATPKSIVKIKSCIFHDNMGTASIIMTSYFGEMDTNDAGVLSQNDDVFSARDLQDVPMAHSVHLTMEDTRFESETVDEIVVVDGGRLQTSECLFTNNSVDSIIQIKSGTLAMSLTEFADNTVKSSHVDMGEGSSLESNDDNCDTTDASSAVEGGSDVDVPVSSRYLQENSTNIVTTTTTDGEANSTTADTIDLNATESAATSTAASIIDLNATDSEAMTNTSDLSAVPVSGPVGGVMTTCHGIYSDGICRKFGDSCAVDLDMPEGCLSSWDELVTAVKERLDDERDFIICPRSTMDIESSTAQAPVVIDSEYITIKCGENGSRDDQCLIVGGYSQFQIVGSASGVELSGLKMMSSRGSSIIAAGTKEATLHLKNCEWDSNIGESAILIHTGPPSEVALDISQLMSAAGGETMAVEIDECIFRKNTLLYGTITNIGGSLTVYKTLFEANTGAKGGDIVITNGGSLKVQESCFDESMSTAPGTIFVQSDSTMSLNINNFGRNNTSVGHECTAVFKEAEGKSCLANPAMCEGVCMDFQSDTCSLPMFDKYVDGPVTSPPVSTPAGVTPVLGETVPSPQESTNLIPIIVASLVAAFIVFGMGGIIWMRKMKKARGGGGDPDVVRSSTKDHLESLPVGNPFASTIGSRRSKMANRDEEMDEAYDGLDDIDEEDEPATRSRTPY